MYFFHGFSDRFDNHEILFSSWNKQGIEVRAFDLPSHGENKGFANNINLYRFRDIAKIFCHFASLFQKEFLVPIVFGGWSLGGLIITRLMQEDFIRLLQQEFPNICYLDWNITALILITPAVYTYPLIGREGIITVQSLTSNPRPPLAGPPKPSTIYLIPQFGVHIEYNAKSARTAFFNRKLKLLMILGGDKEDVYCDTVALKQWSAELHERSDIELHGIQCETAFHMVDNEPEPVCSFVRNASSQFIIDSITGVPHNPSLQPRKEGCNYFLS